MAPKWLCKKQKIVSDSNHLPAHIDSKKGRKDFRTFRLFLLVNEPVYISLRENNGIWCGALCMRYFFMIKYRTYLFCVRMALWPELNSCSPLHLYLILSEMCIPYINFMNQRRLKRKNCCQGLPLNFGFIVVNGLILNLEYLNLYVTVTGKFRYADKITRFLGRYFRIHYRMLL